MLKTNVELITAADIERLRDDEVPESKTLDYKEAIRLQKKDERETFCEHVTSFANAMGGWLVYGLREAKDAAGGRLGIPGEIIGVGDEVPDDELLRLIDEVLRHGVQPRLEVRARLIPGFSKSAKVLVIYVPQSFRGPHMLVQGRAKFFTRSNAGKEAMDVDQLRASFGASAALADRVQEFRLERVGRIVAEATPIRFYYQRGRVVLHLIPLTAFGVVMPDLLEQASRSTDKLLPLWFESGGYSHHFNLDGFCVHDERDESGGAGYVQVFRRGMIEAVDSYMLSQSDDQGAGKLYTLEIEPRVVYALQRYVAFADRLGIRGPAVVMLSLVNVLGYVLAEGFRRGRRRSIDRAQALLPEVVVEDISVAAEPTTLKPIFDAMWQTVGIPKSPNFDERGDWNPQTR